MAFNIEALVWYIILIDSLGCNILTWCCSKKYTKKFKRFSKLFPATKGWAIWYLILVLWVGAALWRMEILPW
tara:strand:- start:221 stop:436 length:216 start_codon:yes stop_codon:yes gene_type:complete